MLSCFVVGFAATFASAVSVGSSVLLKCLRPEAVSPLVLYQLLVVIAAVHVGTCYF
jgi:hypothetical protein